MAKTGRPRKEIDKDTFEKLCALFCTEDDIADFFECSVDTISRWCQRTYHTTFADIYRKKRAKGKVSLRRMQFESAQKGNATMQIWLGRNYLGQSERQEAEQQEGGGGITINISPASAADIEDN